MLSQNAIRRYARDRLDERVKAGTVKRELETLRAALICSEREGWVARAPRFAMPVRKPKPRERWLTRAAANTLLYVAVSPHIRLFILIAIQTGACKAAIEELTWECVNLAQRIIDFGEGHGNKRRAIAPISDQLHTALSEAAEIRTSAYVLEWSGRAVGNVKHASTRTAERSGQEGVTPHVLRHTAATWMVMDGVSYGQVGQMIGATADIVENVYGHHSPDYLRGAATSL